MRRIASAPPGGVAAAVEGRLKALAPGSASGNGAMRAWEAGQAGQVARDWIAVMATV